MTLGVELGWSTGADILGDFSAVDTRLQVATILAAADRQLVFPCHYCRLV